jgi:hypothetical protein
MSSVAIPSLNEFLAASEEEVAKVAPITMVYGVGGTRRHAIFANIEPLSNNYMQWARSRTIDSAELIFRHGVRNLLMVAIVPGNLKEVNLQQDRITESARWVIAGTESLADYKRLGWRVRLIGTESMPELSKSQETLLAITPTQSKQTLYWCVVRNSEDPWQQVLAAAQRSQARTRTEVMKELYGEEIPAATLYLAFGKPTLSTEIIPPLLVGQLQCYWTQQPGYTLTEIQLRTILYDYAYLRPTWQEEKVERARAALADRQAWEEGPILGLGMRLGPFWYPAPISSSAWPVACK